MKPKIKVVQYQWGDQNRSCQIGLRINEIYCQRHGYDYVVKTFPPRDDRAWCWSKIPAIREELHDCDFLLYLDANAFFYSQELKIEGELIPLLEDKQIMMSANCICERMRYQPNKPNTGVIFVRNTEKSAEILRVWDGASERPGLEEFRFGQSREQETCYRTIWQEHAEDLRLLKDYYLMNGTRGIFIRHFMDMTEADRLEGFKTFLESRKEMTPILDCFRMDFAVPRAEHQQQNVDAQNSEKTWTWGIGILTTTFRTDAALARTLESYRSTGFAPPAVFTDRDRNGGLWNFHRALKSLVETYPDADAYMIAEDDVLFSKDIRNYLESELWPSVDEHGCICSIFTPTCYVSSKRWHTKNRGKNTWMSQCRIYHPLSAKKLVADLDNDPRLQNRWRQNDAVIGEWAKKNGVRIWFHSPSLTQHIVSKATSYGMNRSLNYRLGMARDFIGENHSIHEYWQEFGTEPRVARLLPKLEIVAQRKCPKTGNTFQFTPEMASNLAEKLNQYNCDVGEISFVGTDLLSWKYAGRCVYPLRMTGKILRTKMTISLCQETDLKPYEVLFDALDIDSHTSEPHLIEKYVSKKSFYTILPQNEEATECCDVFRLFDNEMFVCSAASGRSGLVPEELASHSWTLDEFFKHFDELLVKFREQKTRKPCPKCCPKCSKTLS